MTVHCGTWHTVLLKTFVLSGIKVLKGLWTAIPKKNEKKLREVKDSENKSK